MDAFFEGEEWVAVFEKRAPGKEVLEEVFDIGILESPASQALYEFCSSRKKRPKILYSSCFEF